MKALLMHQERDFDTQQELPHHAQALGQDLELSTLLRAMAGEDEYLLNVASKALFAGLHNDVETILYRQEIVRDCLKNPAGVRALYAVAVAAVERKSGHWLGIFSRYPSGILYESVELLGWFAGFLRKLKDMADAQAGRFESRGFTRMFAMLQKEFDEEYFARINHHLKELKFRGGMLESAELGPGMAGTHYILRQARGTRPSWWQRLLGFGPREFAFGLHDRDEAGARIVSGMRDQSINLVADALAQSTDHILGFFDMLRTELGFYIGCLNLHEQLKGRSVPICFPQPAPAGARRQCFCKLHDVSLALAMKTRIVSNDVNADGKNLIVITGANQGGKSSFLRGVGLAQVMMQSGLFVAAESFAGEICTGLFTHYRREEDATMESGKLDEELGRMSGIIDAITPHAMLLFNESFASTNEREGSEIARQIVRAMVERGIKVYFVTHLYDFAHTLFEQHRPDALFLRAQRRDDGTRTFQLAQGEPLETSYGEDLYRRVFGEAEIPVPQGDIHCVS